MPTSREEAGPGPHAGTHEVTNQPPPIGDVTLFGIDPVLRAACADLPKARRDALAAYGREMGRAETREEGRVANRHGPELVAFDPGGRRLDEVRFHPAWHSLLARGIGAGYAATAWEAEPGGHRHHAAMVYLASQIEPGHCCPMTMTYAAMPVLRAEGAGWTEDLVGKIMARRHDGSAVPVADKPGVTIGMAMTEKQGGSDVRANSTRAERDGEGWRLTGHKWFCSAPMSDAFLTLAQAPGGLTCFLAPRWQGFSRNPIHIMRLKDKLGNRSNASAEIEYHGAFARMLGAEGDGIRTILQMVHHTRLDTAMAPAGLMRRALFEAHHWVGHRSAFQRRLIDQPLMRAVLADLVVDWAGATLLGMRVARAFDDPGQAPFARIAVAIAKFWSNTRCPQLVFEAMQCLGGSGYVEESVLPLLFRESPLNAIWEGSGNVICLDILRTLAREPRAAEALRAELAEAAGRDARYDAALSGAETMMKAPAEGRARALAERLALLLQTAIALHEGPEALAEALLARLEAGHHTAGACALDADGLLALL